MTRTGSVLGALLALVVLGGAAEGQPGNSRARMSVVGAPADPTAVAPPPESISLEVKDVDVVDLLLGLAAQRRKNIVIGDDVKGTVSLTLRNVPWELALETVLESRGLQKIETDNVIRIVSTEQLMHQREVAARLQEAKAKAEAAERARQEALARGPLREETIRLFYADPVEVARTFQGLLGIPPPGVQYELRGGIAPGPFESYEPRYCPPARTFYPQISQCPGGWQTGGPGPQ